MYDNDRSRQPQPKLQRQRSDLRSSKPRYPMASVSECNEARKVQSPAKRNRGTVDCLFLLLSMFVLSSIARCD